MTNSQSTVSLLTGDDPLDGDPELRQELAELFLADYSLQLSKIREAIDDRNGPELRIVAHTLKGSCGVFRDQQAYDAALKLEHAGRDLDWLHAAEMADQVYRETNRLAAVLTEHNRIRMSSDSSGKD